MIEVNNLSRYYGDFCAVNNISFTINKGEITGLLGPNGAGKTSTMRMITGFLKSSSGDVLVGDVNVNDDPTAVKKMIGYLPESAPLYGDMMVYDYLVYAANIHDIAEPETRINETAGLCGLIPVMHKNINELSKGYRQRVGLAHAMIHNPEILILDEPTNGLDPNQIIEIRNLIKEIGKEKTVILSTHILPEVEATCDRIIIINQGKIVADNTTDQIQSASENSLAVKVSLTGASVTDVSENFKSINGILSVREAFEKDGLVSVILDTVSSRDLRPEVFKKAVEKGWVIYDLGRDQNSLEQVFRDLTLGGENE
ncbi:MAG: ATP-binding cassette domain-containing protein [Spirochaetes bacterium]|nr:ATP-binding cassette domain-containing protein [Spirochaetota bacterium]MBN2771632.1 ATP-binding cassette domain-containing protein [Spirochaetota bacterium]